MDRSIVYTAELPRTVDFLNANKMAMMGLAYAMKGCLGYTGLTPAPPYVEGLACTPTTPTADLNVHVNVGSIYAVDNVDATAYSDLGTDVHNILKQGILNDPVSLAITPPSSPGFSQVFLVQAALQDVDTGSQVLPYYNAANPSQPYSGPGNNGTSQFTIRQVNCVVALKAGVAAPTGSQIPPTQDVGYVGLWWVTVTNGQTQITGANIAQATTAPFFPTLPSMPYHIQNGDWISADDTGTTNNMVITCQPPPSPSNLKYQKFRIKVKNTNTGPVNLTVNGYTGGIYVAGGTPSSFPASALLANTYTEVVCDGINYQLTAGSITINNNSFTTGGPTAGLVNVQAFTASGTYTPTSGATKALIFCTAGGGSGSTVCSGGSGGGAGGTAINLISLSGISSLPITIGAGGPGAPGSRASGSPGGDSYVGTSPYKAYAVGGGGGVMLNGGNPGESSRGGLGGLPTVGLLLIAGGDGENGDNSDNSFNGNGGGSFWGGGGLSGVGNGNTSPNARAFGAASGGCDDANTGAGMSGVVMIMEF